MNNVFPLISIIILNYNGREFSLDCIDSVLKSDYPNFEVIVVDNASADDSLSLIEKKFGRNSCLRIIKNTKNFLYAGGNNSGIRQARGEYIIILNNDTEVDKDWLKEIFLVMRDEKVGAAQPKILIFNQFPKTIDYAGAGIDRFGYAKGFARGEIDRGQINGVQEIFYAGGTAMILKKKILNEVGLFDERFGAHWEDTDLSWRIRLHGYKIVLIPKAVVYHKGSLSMRKFAKSQKVAFWIRKNRIAGLFKNYSIYNLMHYLPLLLIIYLLVFLKELVLDRNIGLAMSSLLAVLWNIKELPYLLQQRRVVQRMIRRVKDAEILKYMEKKPLFLKEI